MENAMNNFIPNYIDLINFKTNKILINFKWIKMLPKMLWFKKYSS